MLPISVSRLLLHRRLPLLAGQGRLASSSTTGLDGRVAVVTGAAKGIGRSIALRLAKDGFDVAINDLPSSEHKLHDLSALITQSGRRAFVCTGNVSVEEDIQRLVTDVVKSLGSVNVMVANAGIFSSGYLNEITSEEWDKLFAVNARGTFLCYKYAAAQMIKQGKGGRIVGASSIAGKQGVSPGATYCATKFAVRGLTQAAAQELAPHKITVNAYAPGLIETDMAAAALQVHVGDSTLNERFQSPLGFNGQPEDIADLVSFLASPASRFITGQSISINGGLFFD